MVYLRSLKCCSLSSSSMASSSSESTSLPLAVKSPLSHWLLLLSFSSLSMEGSRSPHPLVLTSIRSLKLCNIWLMSVFRSTVQKPTAFRASGSGVDGNERGVRDTCRLSTRLGARRLFCRVSIRVAFREAAITPHGCAFAVAKMRKKIRPKTYMAAALLKTALQPAIWPNCGSFWKKVKRMFINWALRLHSTSVIR